MHGLPGGFLLAFPQSHRALHGFSISAPRIIAQWAILLIRRRDPALAVVAGLAAGMAMSGGVVFLGRYFRTGRSHSPTEAGGGGFGGRAVEAGRARARGEPAMSQARAAASDISVRWPSRPGHRPRPRLG
ncbi:hypothetical protein C5746_12230 [Streptomyces atratus]|uniref:Uncharacterized protein n=1 Tax=Streptomyces atratus TaxID=1893 RepID=A0A2Z5JB49_STRAR|nr:hypothetical protein C5746_12230 [Streptomyces atratus]